MTHTTAKPMNHLNLTYSGNGKYTVTWAGWPSEGSKAVRRVIHTEYSTASEVAPIAAQLFADWLETEPRGDNLRAVNLRAVLDLVTCAHIKADKTAVGVAIEWQEVV